LLSVLSSDLLSILLSALLSEPFSFTEETEDVVPPALSTLLVVPEELLLQAAAERAKIDARNKTAIFFFINLIHSLKIYDRYLFSINNILSQQYNAVNRQNNKFK
jgi:hypothetical protein